MFEQEKQILLAHFPNDILEISHGGSTAIPNIPAKPIIDMFVAVSSLEVAEKIRGELETLGYYFRGKEGVSGQILFAKGPEEKRTHYLHLVEKDNDEWKNHILIKDYYLKHPEVAEEYATLKIKLAELYPNDRASYSKAKSDFISSIIERSKKDKL